MFFVLYKKRGETSRDVVNKVKAVTRVKKTGHAGTLDPLAAGILIVASGREDTKKLHTSLFEEKEYIAVIKLGETSTTDDSEGEKEKVSVKRHPKIKEVKKVCESYVGEISQIPPLYSAVKVNGYESYKLARKGVSVEHKERKVEIKEIELLDYQYPLLKIRVVTGSGVYIRSLARDIGCLLVGGAYLQYLVRTRVGDFILKDCINLKQT